MSNLQQLPKPNADITDYEWEVTPLTIKLLIDHFQQLLAEKQKKIQDLEAENKWLRQQLEVQLERPSKSHIPSVAETILWATIGLILTIGGTFIQAYTITPPWHWGEQGIKVETLEVSYQIGAVLLIGCLGGKNAALLSQIAYVILGLTFLPIFDQGGGWEYIKEPNFGYIIGFILGAWLCGVFAFQKKAKLDNLAFSCLAGFLTIHLTGIFYLLLTNYLPGFNYGDNSLWQSILSYSIYPLPGQLAVVCAATSIAFLMRKLMFS
jgi:biotin transport system substrate-specific component